MTDQMNHFRLSFKSVIVIVSQFQNTYFH